MNKTLSELIIEIVYELKEMGIKPMTTLANETSGRDGLIILNDGWFLKIQPEGKYFSLDRLLTDGEVLEGVYVKHFEDLKTSLKKIS